MKPLVSIIVPVYKGEKYIEKCLESLISQSYKNIEIIVIYSPSPDKTLEILNSIQKDRRNGRKIRIIKCFRRKNPASARNIGLKIAKGEYIAFCDHDDLFVPTKIEEQIKFLERNKNVGLVYTNVVMIDENDTPIRYLKCPEWDREYWLRNRFIATSSVLFRRELINVNGYFDESPLLVGVEDFDYLIRASKKTIFKGINKFLTYHREHSESLSAELSADNNKMILWRAFTFLKNGFYFFAIKEFILWGCVRLKSFINELFI